MRVAINQPTYLPWIGYLDLIDQVDLFVILDSVQFEKQSWQQRNRIRTATGLQWLSVPVKFRGRFGQLIKDVEIREPDFYRSHVRAIELAYRRSPYFGRYFGPLEEFLRVRSTGLLADLNFDVIFWLLEMMQIRTPLQKSSTLAQSGKRTELLANICKSVGATEYVSPLGSAEYLLSEQEILAREGIKISFQNYSHPEYRQVFSPFEPFASVIDLLFNAGERSLEILRSGRRECYSAQQLQALAHVG
jgi:hypothetical protein